ncbi:Metallo-dependent phosphatase, partial [Agrocybe pediades]
VYYEYDPWTPLPPKPSDEWTRFVCISDTQSHVFKIPDGDVLLHSGDLMNPGTGAEFEKTMKWLYGLPHRFKIIIAGNHDLALHEEWYEEEHQKWVFDSFLLRIPSVRLNLWKEKDQDSEHQFQVRSGGKMWMTNGSPVTLQNFSKFAKTEILLTHGPAHQIFDRIVRGDEIGCEALRTRISELRPRLHLAGHIHEAHGAYVHTWDPSSNFEPPEVQNDHAFLENSQDLPSGVPDDAERTLFINAANWPMGVNARRNGVQSAFGGPGFQAVVVDMKE